jgi:Glycosyl transferase family 2
MTATHSGTIPWLAVIMPAYNGERWIGAALESLAAEAAEGIEVLLIDGGPTSAAVEVAKSFADRLDLRVHERPDLSLWQSKTNFGVSIARAAHVCWLHVDDVWYPGRASTIARWISQRPDASLHLGPSAIIDAKGREIGVWRCPLPANSNISPAVAIERLLIQNFIPAPAPVFRKDAWLASGGLDEALWYTADWDIWLKLARSGAVYYHEELTVGFRIHPGSLTISGSRNAADFGSQMRAVLSRHLLLNPTSSRVERVARASIAVNIALAAAASGNLRKLFPAVYEVLRLGPRGAIQYMATSRILDRLLPRLRARFSGDF